MRSAAADSNSMAKSRSLTASNEFSATASNASSFALSWRSIANVVPASAPAPSGQGIDTPAALAEAFTIAHEHFEPCQHMVPEGDGLGRLQMGEAGHEGLRLALGEVHQRRHEIA